MNTKLIARHKALRLFILAGLGFDVATYTLTWLLHRRPPGPPATIFLGVQGLIFSPARGLSLDAVDRARLDPSLTEAAKALALKAGVPAPEVWTYPSGKKLQDRYACVQDGTIFISRALANICTPRELEFVIAHEVAHLEQVAPRDPWNPWLFAAAYIPATAGVAFVRNEVFDARPWILFALAAIAFFSWSKRKKHFAKPVVEVELGCDRKAIELTGDPEAAVTLLEKITHPLKVRQALSDYPNLEQRLANLQP